MNKRMILMLLGMSVVFGGIFGFKAFVNAMITEVFDTMPEPVATVTATEARAMDWVHHLGAVGSFAAVAGADLSPEVAGIVREIHFESGSAVEAGAVLVVLDLDTDLARLRSLEAASNLARLELERARRLAGQRTLSEADLQRRESEAEQADAAIEEQRARIAQKTVRAPFSGRLGIRQVNAGQYLAPGDPVVSLQAMDPIHLNFSLPERYVSAVQAGQSVHVRVDAYDSEFQGRIAAVEPRISDSTRTFALQAIFANGDQRLRPGMFGRVTLEMGNPESVVVVPQTAVSFSAYGDSVYVIVEGDGGDLRVSRRFVQTGPRRGDLVVIRDGLDAGTRVATSGLLKLRNNSPVTVNDDPALQPSEDPAPTPDNA